MKAVVIGAGGQLGRALVASAPAGTDVLGLTRAQLDVADERSVVEALQAHRPDVVINAAAYTAVDKAERETSEAQRINCGGAARLAQECAKNSIGLVHVSTDFVFDGKASSPYRPNHPVCPIGVYGASKADGERAVFAALPDSLVVRTAWVYSADGANFVRTMLRLLAERPAVRVVADQVGTPTHVASLARGLWQLLGLKASGIHHFTDAGVASWYDFAVAIQEEALALGLLARAVPIVPIRTEDYPTPARRPAYSVLDKTDTYMKLGGPAPHWRRELRAALAEMNVADTPTYLRRT